MRRRTPFHALATLALAAGLLAGCGDGAPEAQDASGAAPAPADSITRRQRDSVIGESRLPGARGVKGALEASDAAAARAATLDSLSNQEF